MDITKRIDTIINEYNKYNDVDGAIHGMTKQQAKNLIYKKTKKITRGIYKDEYWQGVKSIWKVLDDLELAWLMKKSEYQHEDGRPIRKIWYIEISFNNKKDLRTVLHGRIVAAGAGSVKDPLDKYDVNIVL